MLSSLDQRIQTAAEKAAANLENWATQYIPIKIDGKVYWLTTAVPTAIQKIIDVLPTNREQTDVKRPHQFKTRLSDQEKDAFEILVTASGLPQGEYIRGMIRQTVIVNKEFAVLDVESKNQLETHLRSLRQLQTYIQRLAEDIHGHLQT